MFDELSKKTNQNPLASYFALSHTVIRNKADFLENLHAGFFLVSVKLY